MRLAFISYEFAGTTNAGGIGTYVRNAAAVMASKGWSVEVFTSGDQEGTSDIGKGVLVHTVASLRDEFRQKLIPVFAKRHSTQAFDVVEGPEYKYDADAVFDAFPEVARVVKLHGPSFTIFESNASYVGNFARMRFYAGALRRMERPSNPWRYDPRHDPERVHALKADDLTANSRALSDRVAHSWGISAATIPPVPLIFSPPASLLNIDPNTITKTVLFVGRLEVRKGVVELAEAIPKVLRKIPDTRFRFVGRALPHPANRQILSTYLSNKLGPYMKNVEFLGGVEYQKIPGFMSQADICVFPSHWEAAGYVALEAMAAARGVIGSSAGGMSEVILDGKTGLLVRPSDPREIADAILTLLRNPSRRIAMGMEARRYATEMHTPHRVAPLQEASYRRAIEKSRVRNRQATRAEP